MGALCRREGGREGGRGGGRERERERGKRGLGTVTFTSPVRQPEVEEEHANHAHVETNEGMRARTHTHALSLTHTPDIPAGSAWSKSSLSLFLATTTVDLSVVEQCIFAFDKFEDSWEQSRRQKSSK